MIRAAKIAVAPRKIIKRVLNPIYLIECPEERDNTEETSTRDSYILKKKLNIDSDDKDEDDEASLDTSVNQTTIPNVCTEVRITANCNER